MPTATKLSKRYKYHYVYQVTNLFPESEEQFYIGSHSCNCKPEEDSYWGSSVYLTRAIASQGSIDFAKEILSVWKTREEANVEEQRIHEELDVANNLKYYNRRNASENFHNGGWSEKTKAKVAEFNKNYNAQPEIHKQLTERTTALWQDPEYREKTMMGHRERWDDPSWREKTLKAMREANFTPELKEKMSEMMKNNWQDPEFRKTRSEAARKSASTPEEKQRRSEAAKRQWADPAYRAMMAVKLKGIKKTKKIIEKTADQVGDFDNLV